MFQPHLVRFLRRMTSPSPAASPSCIARLVFLPLWLSLCSLTVPGAAAAQTPSQTPHSVVTDTSQPEQPPAHLAVVEGTVTLERDARVEPALANMPLLAGDHLRTEAGHVAVRFGSGSMLELDRFSDVDLHADSLVQILSGALHVVLVSNVACSPPESWCLAYRIDAAPGSVVLHTVGDYRVSLSSVDNDPRIDLTVLHGSATLQNGRGTVLVGAGSRAWAFADVPPSQPVPADTTASALDDRVPASRRTTRLSAPPPQHLPTELAEYDSELDRAGSWSTEAPFGSVWYPRVGVGWRPYASGIWSFAPSLGWVWIGLERWSWPTHHYGRWGLNAKGWFWVPGRQWAPAWVAWAYTPQYVSWCPLGPSGAPVVSPRTSRTSANAWSLLPAQAFKTGGVTGRPPLPRALTPSLRTSLEVRSTPPPATVPAGRAAMPLIGPVAGRATNLSLAAPAAASTRIGVPHAAAPARAAGSPTAPGTPHVPPAGAPLGAAGVVPSAGPRGGAAPPPSGAAGPPPTGGVVTSHIGPPPGQGREHGR